MTAYTIRDITAIDHWILFTDPYQPQNSGTGVFTITMIVALSDFTMKACELKKNRMELNRP